MQLEVKELHLVLERHFFLMKSVIVVRVTITLHSDKARFLTNDSEDIKSIL